MTDSVGSGTEPDRVAQAVEMVCAQRNCGPEQAHDLLRERAFTLGQSLEYTALDVLDHIIRFNP
jgi:hypothetical protein